MRYLIGHDATWIDKLAPAFPTPALRNEREEWGTLIVVVPRNKESEPPADPIPPLDNDPEYQKFRSQVNQRLAQ